ncbi:hypothetical protein RFI_20209, partial [Reticulomyxa filosa]
KIIMSTDKVAKNPKMQAVFDFTSEHCCKWKSYVPYCQDSPMLKLVLAELEESHWITALDNYFQKMSDYSLPKELCQIIVSYVIRNGQESTKDVFFKNFASMEFCTAEHHTALHQSYRYAASRIENMVEKFLMLTGDEQLNYHYLIELAQERNARPSDTISPIFAVMRKMIKNIIWYRYGVIPCGDLPLQPSDIFGQLWNGQWFYYKDGHPHWYGATTHSQWIGLANFDLSSLLQRMDRHDVDLLYEGSLLWKPLALSRCGCFKCDEETVQFGKGADSGTSALPAPKQEGDNEKHFKKRNKVVM